MRKFSLEASARRHIAQAAASTTGRSAETIYGGHEHVLRQTLVALRAGASMSEHESPGDATVFVLRGRVRLRSGDVTWDGMTGDLLVVPPDRHSLEAIEDAAVLLTVGKAL